MGKEHDDWLRQLGLDPDKYLINADAGTPAAKGADANTLRDKVAASLDLMHCTQCEAKLMPHCFVPAVCLS